MTSGEQDNQDGGISGETNIGEDVNSRSRREA